MDLNWYVVRAVSGQEKKIKTYLENEISRKGLEEYIPQILIPAEKVYEMRNGKKRVRERNFFPGYVLVSADLSHGEAQHTVTNIPGVIGFLGSGTGGSKVPGFYRSC
jgi:transcriptional antiterminator NusG